MENCISSPVTGPSPPVCSFGWAWMPPGCTELAAVNDEASTASLKLRLPAEPSRETNATSDGELTRVGTAAVEKSGAPLVRPTSKSFGKTR